MKSSLLRSIIRVSIITTFFVPLIVVPSQFIFPFIVPKILAFRALVLVMLFGYVLLALGDKNARPRRTALSIAMVVFLASFFISTVEGVDWYKSMWDNHERMLGLFTIIHYVLYYAIATSTVREWKEWNFLARYFAGAAGLVMLLGFVQKLQPEFLVNRGAERVSATLGNPIYLGGYGLFLFFFGILFACQSARPFWRWYFGLSAVLGFFGIFISGTRGALLGLIAGVVCAAAIYSVLAKDRPRVRQSIWLCFGAAVLALFILYNYREVPAVRNIPALGQLLNVELTGDSVGTRIMAWQVAVDAWQDRPLFGWGPNNYFYAFNHLYRPEFLNYGWNETWFDNAHNVLLNTLAVQGAFGLLSYVSIFVCACWMIWQARKAGRLRVEYGVIMVGFLTAHLVQNIFVFENPTSYLFFMFFLALINSVTLDTAPNGQKQVNQNVSAGAVAVTASIIVLCLYATDINPMRANMATLAAIKAIYSGQPARPVYENVARLPSPHIDDIRNDIARTVLQMMPAYVQAKRQDEAHAAGLFMVDELEKNNLLHPLDVRTAMMQGQLIEQLYGIKKDVSLLQRAEQSLTVALANSPKRQQLEYQLADYKLSLGKINEAEAILRASITNNPKIPDGWIRLTAILTATKRVEEAKRLVAEAAVVGVRLPDVSVPAAPTTTSVRKSGR